MEKVVVTRIAESEHDTRRKRILIITNNACNFNIHNEGFVLGTPLVALVTHVSLSSPVRWVMLLSLILQIRSLHLEKLRNLPVLHQL